MIVSRFFWVTKHTNLYKNYPFPQNVHPHPQQPLSAAHNHLPGNELELLNCMCVLVLTRNDGTLFDAAFIQEEDIIELCIELGQTHPKCVLWYSVTESVVLLHSADEMLVMEHGVIKAMALHKETIQLHMSLPFTLHVRAYVAVRDGHPSGTHSPTPDREIGCKLILNHPLATSNWMGGSHASIRWILDTLGMPS